jgi:hypothetical protein
MISALAKLRELSKQAISPVGRMDLIRRKLMKLVKAAMAALSGLLLAAPIPF